MAFQVPCFLSFIFGLLTHTSFCITLVGTIPSSIGYLTGMSFLDLGSNSIPGTIDWYCFVQLTHTSFYITLIGTIPSSIAKLTNLHYLYFGANSLTGVILYWLLHIATSNTISTAGTIPSLLCDLPLEEMYLQENKFTTGTMDWFFYTTYLYFFLYHIHRNRTILNCKADWSSLPFSWWKQPYMCHFLLIITYHNIWHYHVSTLICTTNTHFLLYNIHRHHSILHCKAD